jgi:hypothetical protein
MWKICIKWKLIISVLFFVLAMQVNWEQNRQPKQKWFFSLQLGEQVYANPVVVKALQLMGLFNRGSKVGEATKVLDVPEILESWGNATPNVGLRGASDLTRVQQIILDSSLGYVPIETRNLSSLQHPGLGIAITRMENQRKLDPITFFVPGSLQYTWPSAMSELDQRPGTTFLKENKYPEADESTKQRDQTDSGESKNLKDLIKEIIGCISDTTLAVGNLINDDSKQRSQNILFEDNDKKLGELVKKIKNVEQRKKYVVRQEERFEKAKKKYMEADKDLDQAKRDLREAEGVLEQAEKDLENLYDNNNETVDSIEGKDLVEAIVKCAKGISK